MKPDPIVEELHKIREEKTRSVGYDIHKYFESLRKKEAAHESGKVIDRLTELEKLQLGKIKREG